MRLLLISIVLFLGASLTAASIVFHAGGGSQSFDTDEIETMTFLQPDEIFVEGGTYSMGDHLDEGWDDELPVHSVSVDNFYMRKFEEYHLFFVSFLNAKNVTSDGMLNGNLMIDLNDPRCAVTWDEKFVFQINDTVNMETCPVITMTWFGACEFANWLSEAFDLTPCYTVSEGDVACDFDASGYRLPTEAEWEYAARGGINWMDNYRYSGCHDVTDLPDYAWYFNAGGALQPVGGKLPNQLELYNMSGSVYEYCWDWFSSDYYAESPQDNPMGPEEGSWHVLRGGDWTDGQHYVRVAVRYSSWPHQSGGYIGFRLVRNE